MTPNDDFQRLPAVSAWISVGRCSHEQIAIVLGTWLRVLEDQADNLHRSHLRHAASPISAWAPAQEKTAPEADRDWPIA